jgi:hypothetical protein
MPSEIPPVLAVLLEPSAGERLHLARSQMAAQ